jgi:predicted NBD/HSP70 family sugar kinase
MCQGSQGRDYFLSRVVDSLYETRLPMPGGESPSNNPKNGQILEQSGLRRHNLGIIFRALRDSGPISRAQLANATGMTKPGVNNIVDELLERGLLTQGVEESKPNRGRPGVLLTINAQATSIIVIELRAFHTAVISFDLLGQELYRERATTSYNLTPQSRITEVQPMLERAIRSATRQASRIAKMIFVIPGIIDSDLKITASSLNWEKLELMQYIKNVMPPSVPIELNTVAKLAAFAEYEYLIKKSKSSKQLLHLELGITPGIAVVQNGELQLGANLSMGNIAHISINQHGKLCRCGKIGCIETEIGFKVLIENTCPDLVKDWSKDSEFYLSEVISRAENGDEDVFKGIELIAESVATTLSFLIPVLDPDRVILGGYAVRISDLLMPRLKYHLEKKYKNISSFSLDTSPLDTDAALFGGFILAQDELFNSPHSIS